MNIFSMLKQIFAPEILLRTDPTRYTPLITRDSDSGHPFSFDSDNIAITRAFKELTDAENELRSQTQQYYRIEKLSNTDPELDRIQELIDTARNRYDAARNKYNEVDFSHRYVKINSIDLITAFREFKAAPESRTRDILWSVTIKTEEKINEMENSLKQLMANHVLQVEPIIEAPLICGKFDVYNPINLDDVTRLSLRLQTAENKYLQAHTQLELIKQSGLQANAASPNRITPFEAIFQLIQYGKELLSDAQVQQLIVSSLTNVTAGVMAAKLGVFALNTSTANMLEVPDYTATNSTSFNI
jgi:hypothetical protein